MFYIVLVAFFYGGLGIGYWLDAPNGWFIAYSVLICAIGAGRELARSTAGGPGRDEEG